MRCGFTLVELVVTVLVLGIITAIATSRMVSIQDDSRHLVVAQQLEKIASAAERFRAANGRWPADALHGVLPSELKDYLWRSDFSPTPIGGTYDWNGPESTSPACGPAVQPKPGEPLSLADMLAIDERLDDGNLGTGRVRRLTVSGRQALHIVLELQ